MNRGQSRLWRRLGATAPVFEVAAHDTWGDDTANQWTITRGSDGNLYGPRANTARVNVPGDVTPSRDQNITIRLSTYGADLLAGLVGNRTAAELAPRFLGRIAKQEVDDLEDGHRYTALTCNDWLSLALGLVTTGFVNDDAVNRLWQLHYSVIDRANLGTTKLPAIEHSDGPWDRTRDLSAGGEIPVETVMGKYGADIAVVDFIKRDGRMMITHAADITPAATNHDPATVEPLTRRQCLSPASWSSNINAPQDIRVEYIDPSGVTQTAYSTAPGTRTKKTVVHNRKYMTGHSASLALLASILGNPHNDPAYLLETVTVDLLALLASELPADRRLAGQLLTAEVMDYVVLSHDWPEELKGFHYLTSITETVTPDQWLLTLGLLPDRHAVGMGILADPSGTTWATAHPADTDWTTPSTDWSA